MKRFEFKLRSVLLIRQRLLNEAERKYSHAIAQRRGVEASIQSENKKIDSMNQVALVMAREQAPAVQRDGFIKAIQRMVSARRNLEFQLQKAREEEHKARMNYIEAHRNHELLLNLREDQRRIHFHETQAKEQAMQDDLFNARRDIRKGVGVS